MSRGKEIVKLQKREGQEGGKGVRDEERYGRESRESREGKYMKTGNVCVCVRWSIYLFIYFLPSVSSSPT
jgi:hypothetical protein